MSPHYKIAPQKSLLPVDNLLAKIRGRRAGQILPVNCQPGGDYSGGNPIMGHRPFSQS